MTINYQEKTVNELRQIAKEMQLVGYSKIRKAELIALIENNLPKEETFVEKEVNIVLNRHQRRRKEKIERIMKNKKKGKTHVYW